MELAVQVTFSCCVLAEYPWKWLTNAPKCFSPANSKICFRQGHSLSPFKACWERNLMGFALKNRWKTKKMEHHASCLCEGTSSCDILTSPLILIFCSLCVDPTWHPHEQRKKVVLPEGIRKADIQRNASWRHLTCNKGRINMTWFLKRESLCDVWTLL